MFATHLDTTAMVNRACLKRSVLAVLVTTDGRTIMGTNAIKNTRVRQCPRDLAGYGPGEGYELCSRVCQQDKHAEVDAVARCKDATGSTVYVMGHDRCCSNCLKTMQDAGVKKVVISSTGKTYNF